MPSDPHVPIPREASYRLWQDSLQRAWNLYRQAIAESQLHQIPWKDAIRFGDALGVSTTDDAVLRAIASNPKAAATCLLFATRLDEVFERDPSQMFELSVGLRGQEVAPFQILA